MKAEDAVQKGCTERLSRTFRPRLPCRQRADAESCMFSHWGTGRSSSTWSWAGQGAKGEGRIARVRAGARALAGAGAGCLPAGVRLGSGWGGC